MMHTHHILADKGDLLQVVVVLIILGVSAIARKLAQRAQQKKPEQHQQRGSARQAPHKAAAPARRPPALRPPWQVPPQPDEALARTFRQQVGMSQQDLPLRGQAEPQTPPPRPVALEPAVVGVGVEMELDRQRSRLRTEELRREDRLAARTPEEAKTEAIEGRILHIPKAAQQPSAEATLTPMVQRLRQAVIWYEILSPPKALRRGQEPWSI